MKTSAKDEPKSGNGDTKKALDEAPKQAKADKDPQSAQSQTQVGGSVAMEPPERMLRETAQRTEEAGKDAEKVMVAVVPTGSLVSLDLPLPPDKGEVIMVHGMRGVKGELVPGESPGTSRVALDQPAGEGVTVEVKRN